MLNVDLQHNTVSCEFHHSTCLVTCQVLDTNFPAFHPGKFPREAQIILPAYWEIPHVYTLNIFSSTHWEIPSTNFINELAS